MWLLLLLTQSEGIRHRIALNRDHGHHRATAAPTAANSPSASPTVDAAVTERIVANKEITDNKGTPGAPCVSLQGSCQECLTHPFCSWLPDSNSAPCVQTRTASDQDRPKLWHSCDPRDGSALRGAGYTSPEFKDLRDSSVPYPQLDKTKFTETPKIDSPFPFPRVPPLPALAVPATPTPAGATATTNPNTATTAAPRTSSFLQRPVLASGHVFNAPVFAEADSATDGSTSNRRSGAPQLAIPGDFVEPMYSD